MGLPRGSTIPLSPGRRFICDMMAASQRVPLVAIERYMPLAPLLQARKAVEPRPSWFALFLKAFAQVARERAELRRSYLSFPWPRLHQHACNVASLAVARRLGEEDVVLTLQIRHPEELPLTQIDALIARARTEPIESISDFRRILLISRLPRWLRRFAWWAALQVQGHWRARFTGTFALTGVAALGSASLHVLSPLTTTLTYGVFSPEGLVPVRLYFDHRVLDGIQTAQALEDLEKKLLGPICQELIGERRRAA